MLRWFLKLKKDLAIFISIDSLNVASYTVQLSSNLMLASTDS